MHILPTNAGACGCRSNRNVFEHNGHTYAWDYMIFLGAKHTLTNLETGEVIAICQLKPGVTTQSLTAWGLRYDWCLACNYQTNTLQFYRSSSDHQFNPIQFYIMRS